MTPLPTQTGNGERAGMTMTRRLNGNGVNADALAKLPPAQVREMREAFQVLDRDGDGLVGREDVVDMLTNLGTCCLNNPWI